MDEHFYLFPGIRIIGAKCCRVSSNFPFFLVRGLNPSALALSSSLSGSRALPSPLLLFFRFYSYTTWSFVSDPIFKLSNRRLARREHPNCILKFQVITRFKSQHHACMESVTSIIYSLLITARIGRYLINETCEERRTSESVSCIYGRNIGEIVVMGRQRG